MRILAHCLAVMGLTVLLSAAPRAHAAGQDKPDREGPVPQDTAAPGAPQARALPSQRIAPEAFLPSNETVIWWLTHAGFLLNARGSLLMLDPAISYTPEPPKPRDRDWSPKFLMRSRMLVSLPIEASEVPRLDAVLYTHGDRDHLSLRAARELFWTGAVFYGPPPVIQELAKSGFPPDRLRVVHAGEPFQVGHVQVAPTPADHPWQLADPEKFGPAWGPGDCVGYLLRTPDGTIWCVGYSRLMDQHLEVTGVDLMLLDVARDTYHMGVEDSARLANVVAAPHVIPCHYGCYDTPDHIGWNGDPSEVAVRLADAERRFHVIAPGARFVLSRDSH